MIDQPFLDTHQFMETTISMKNILGMLTRHEEKHGSQPPRNVEFEDDGAEGDFHEKDLLVVSTSPGVPKKMENLYKSHHLKSHKNVVRMYFSILFEGYHTKPMA